MALTHCFKLEVFFTLILYIDSLQPIVYYRLNGAVLVCTP